MIELRTHSRPKRTYRWKAKPLEPLGTPFRLVASRKPSLSRTSIEAGSGFTWRSRLLAELDRSCPGALKGLFLGHVVDLLDLGKRGNILGGDRDRLRRRASDDVATISTRSSMPRRASRRLIATRPNSPR